MSSWEWTGESADEIADTFTAERDTHLKPFPGALDMLRTLKEPKLLLALITNEAGNPQRDKINRFGLDRYFDLILIEGEFGAGKPDPQVYTYALEQLDAQPQEAWMVGDHIEFDIGAPQQLGIFGIWINSAGGSPPATSKVEPDRVIRTLNELL